MAEAAELVELRREVARLRDVEIAYNALRSPSAAIDAAWKPTPANKAAVPGRKPFSGDHIALDVGELMAEGGGGCYHLVTSGITPRPIAFVSTLSGDGQTANLSPFSYFGVLGHAPPVVAVGFVPQAGAHKDSLRNALETGEFVVNIISEWMVEAANFTCGSFPAHVDEFDVGFTKAPCDKVRPPRVKESAFSMECKVLQTIEAGGSTIVLGEVVTFHVQEELLDTSRASLAVKFDGYKPVARLGGNTFAFVGDTLDIARPPADAHAGWAKELAKAKGENDTF